MSSLGLAAIGVYGLAAFSVATRTREIGIRMALGAQARTVLGAVLRESLVLASVGATIGLGGAVVIAKLL